MQDLCLYNQVKWQKLEYFDLVLTVMAAFCSAGYIPYIKECYDSKQVAKYSSISLTTM
jgi:hypothetical protein